MNKEKLIKKLQETKLKKVEVEIPFSEGDVIYSDFSIFISDETILLQVNEIK